MTDFDMNYWLNMSNEEREANAPQKSTVTNHTPAATQGGWANTDDYAQAREVVNRLRGSGTCISDDYNDYLKVNFAFAHAFGESGRSLAEAVCAMSSKFDAADFNKKYDNCLRTGNGSITIATFYQMARDAGVDIRTSRPETPPFATFAESHSHTKYSEKDKPLIINENKETHMAEAACEPANGANGTETPATNSHFSDKIDEADWCPFMRKAISPMDTAEGKDKMALITLNMISGVIPNYYSIYSNKVVYPTLYIIYYGPAGSLKGEIADAVHVLTPLKREAQASYAREMATYEQEHAQWEAKGGRKERSERGPEPQKPDFITPLIPGDSSASKVIRHLKANGQMGASLFESEARVISNTLSADYGKQWSTILLKAAHHETVSHTRVEDDRFIEIEEPRLAVGLTCTPGLLPKFFPSFEDGLGSRFLYKRLERKIGWRNPFQQTDKILADTYKELGEEFLELYHELLKLGNRRIQFLMTEDQQNRFNEYFAPLTEEQTDMLGEGSESFIYRLGIQGNRIAMLLALLRRYCEWDRTRPLFEPNEQAIICTDTDFRTMLEMVDTLVNDTAKIYASLAKEEDLNPFNHKVNLNAGERRLYDALPDEYDTEIIRQVVRQVEIKPATAKRYIGDFVNKHQIAERITTGHYRKTNLRK